MKAVARELVRRDIIAEVAALCALGQQVPDELAELLLRIGALEAGSQIFSLHPEAGTLGPWTGFGLFCLYAAIALGVGFALINRRDA